MTYWKTGRNVRCIEMEMHFECRYLRQLLQRYKSAERKSSRVAALSSKRWRWKGDSVQKWEFMFFLQGLVDTNHCLLASLDVSHPALERVRTVSQEQGLHTKVYLHLTRWWWMMILNGAGARASHYGKMFVSRFWWSKAMLIINNHSHPLYSVNLISKVCTYAQKGDTV